VTLGVSFDDTGWFAAYCEAREFKRLPRREQEVLARNVEERLKPLDNQLAEIAEKADESDDDVLFESASTAECTVGSFLGTVSDFLRRRASWKEFGLGLEEMRDDLEDGLTDCSEHHPSTLPLIEMAFEIAEDFLARVDTGNRLLAEEHANRIAHSS
jgi:hypothetical protein